MKKIFKEDIQAVKTALKGENLRPNVKIELQELLQSFEKQLKNNENTGLSAVAVVEKETPEENYQSKKYAAMLEIEQRGELQRSIQEGEKIPFEILDKDRYSSLLKFEFAFEAENDQKIGRNINKINLIKKNWDDYKNWIKLNPIKMDEREAFYDENGYYPDNGELDVMEIAPTTRASEIFAKVKTTPTQEKNTENDPKTIAELVAWVKDNPKSNELKSVVYGEVTGVQAAAIEKATNIDISGFERVLDSYGIKHILKNHGGASEELRGQEPITLEDFKKIPDVVENYDKVFRTGINKRELETIAYLKRTNGVFFLLEEIREKKKKNIKQTVTQTLYKFKVGNNKTPDELMLSIQKAYTQDTSPTLTSDTFPGDANVTKKTDKPKLSIVERIDALKELSKYANETTKKGLSARIKILKELLKYTK